MGAYLQHYGEGDRRRELIIKASLWTVGGLIVLGIFGYFLLKDRSEKHRADEFLQLVNTQDYQGAYRLWGCTDQHPCPNYPFDRFMQDWGRGKSSKGAWTVASTDSCRKFLTVNVRAPGSDPASLSVQRSDESLGFAPADECQERKWRWKQFFQRVLGGTPTPTRPKPSA